MIIIMEAAPLLLSRKRHLNALNNIHQKRKRRKKKTLLTSQEPLTKATMKPKQRKLKKKVGRQKGDEHWPSSNTSTITISI